MCECLKIEIKEQGQELQTFDVLKTGTFNGYNVFEFTFDGDIFYIWHDSNNTWYVTLSPVGDPSIIRGQLKSNTDQCPIASKPEWTTTGTIEIFNTLVGNCEDDCGCLKITITENGGESETLSSQPAGEYNNNKFWSYCLTGGNGINVYSESIENGCRWIVELTDACFDPIGTGNVIFLGALNNSCTCPTETTYTPRDPKAWLLFSAKTCKCEPIEDRHKRKYDAIKLPEIFEEQNRGWKSCCDCEPMLTLASPENETWKNDITSAWIKLSDPTDVVEFVLKKDGVETTYTPTIKPFQKEPNAFYTTINWIDVLNDDGIGCYKLSVRYNISGIIGELFWGSYNLKPFSIKNALGTARIRVKFNLQQEIEGLNFTGSDVEDTIRFAGFIGERQPNMEIDNLIYQNRNVKTVVRENLNSYQITTDPSGECLITKLTDLYLLSENEMWISDHNAHNHSYKYLDIPTVVSESPEIEYINILQRKAILKCQISDRNKNKRTFY